MYLANQEDHSQQLTSSQVVLVLTIKAGTYSITDRSNEALTKSKGFSMSSRHQEIQPFTARVPGPGA